MISGRDVAQLKAYVAAPASGIQCRLDSTVLLFVSHSNLSSRFAEIRLDLHMPVDAVKAKLTSHCGTSPSAMILQLKDDQGSLLATLDAQRKLGYYSPQDGYTLHIIDTDPSSASANGWLEDVSKVSKYVMSEEAYDRREDTFRKFKEAKVKDDPTWTLEKEMAARRGQNPAAPRSTAADEHLQQAEAESIGLGDRCEVFPGGRRGTVRFVGQCAGLPGGSWVGVEYDEPVGKNDGTVEGTRYFSCLAGYGGFVRPSLVSPGDFPPSDAISFSDNDEI